MTPGSARSTSWASTILARSHTSTPDGILTPLYRSFSSVVTMTLVTPSARSHEARFGTGMAPAASWPPVMATAEL